MTMRIIDRFSNEHASFIVQLDQLQAACAAGAPIADLVRAARSLAAPLLKHAENEELLLFPDLIARMGGEGPVNVLQQEHVTIHGQVDRLAGEPSRGDFLTVFGAFQRLLLEHIAKEEDVVFPLSAEILGDTRLSEMDAEIAVAV